MNVGFSNFASAFQSVQASHSQTTNKVATASTMANNVALRADVLTLHGQRIEPSTYHRPVMPVNNTLEGRLCTQGETAQFRAMAEAQNETKSFATAPQTITVSTYFGDTLVWTTTMTKSPSDTPDKWLASEQIEDFMPIGSPERQAAWQAALAEGKITRKATYAVGGEVVAEQKIESRIDTVAEKHVTWHSVTMPHIIGYCEHGGWLTNQSTMFVLGDAAQKNNAIISDAGSISVAGLGRLLGIENATNKASLLTSLDKLIADEAKDLNAILSRKLGKAGLGDVTKKITFAEDKDGNIVIEGNISAKEKRRLAQIINDDPELVERIKTQKARMEIAEELKKEDGDINLSHKKFDAARTQILKDFLQKHGTSLNDFFNAREEVAANNFTIPANSKYTKLYDLLDSSNAFPELHVELGAYMDRQNAPTPSAMTMPGEVLKVGEKREEKSDAVRSLLSMHRGVLAEATDEERNFNGELGQIRTAIYKKIVDKYNDMYSNDPNAQIAGFNMKIDDQGRLTIIDVQTWGNNADDNKRAEKVMNTWLNTKLGDEEEKGPTIREVAKEIGLAMLETHDAEHGDVHEFKHEIISTSFNYEILSPEADRAALAEMETLTQDIGAALGDFFGKNMGIENSFGIIFGSDGLLSLDKGALSSMESETVKKVLAEINDYFAAEEAGEETKGMLSPALTGIAEKLGALKEVMGKLHDKSLIPKDVRFGVNG